MASPGSITVANIGTQTIGMARFLLTGEGGLVLERYKFTEILGDPASDPTRVSQTRLAVSELVDALKLKGSKAAYSLSGQSVFARFVKLPPVATDKVDQIVTFEAQQNVPFPLSEVVWDYQILSEEGAEQIEVLLVAIKDDGLEDINRAIEDGPLSTETVDIAPAALYNAMRYTYSDVPGCTMLVDLGSRTTNLIFAEGGKVFSRSIPLGGSTITQAIAKELNVPFAAAEDFKRKHGFVSLGGAYADPPDPNVALVSKLVRNAMTRVHSEIARSISFYRSQQGGSQPARVLVCGGTSVLPYMREFLSEKLQLPIDFFNPLRNVAVGRDIDVDQVVKDGHLLGELVGLALRGTGVCPLELNLRPPSVVSRQALSKQKPYLVAAAVAFLGALGALFLYFDRAAGTKEGVLEEVRTKVSALQELEKKQEAVVREQKALQAKADVYLGSVRERDAWLRVISEIAAALPREFVWVTRFEPTINRQPIGQPQRGGAPTPPAAAGAKPEATPKMDGVRITGLYLFNNARKEQLVNDFVEALSRSALFNIDLSKPREVILKLDSQNNRDWAFPYELQIQLKQPVSL